MSFITKPISGILGSVTGQTQSDAAEKAGQTQADAANHAADLANQAFEETRGDLAPYRDLGTSNIGALTTALKNPLLSSVFSYGNFTAPTQSEAAATPGYQFTLQQGLKAAQNSASARGLGASGAAIKGAENYATGLADSTYNDVYNRDLGTYTTNRNNALSNFATNYGVANDQVNRLLGLVTTGENAAAQTGAMGQQTAATVGNDLTSGAAAKAAGTVGTANAYGGALGNATNLGTTLYGLNKLTGLVGGAGGITGGVLSMANATADPIGALWSGGFLGA